MVNFRPTGHITEKTKHRMSLANALGYKTSMGRYGQVYVFRRIPRGDGTHKLKLAIVIKKEDLFDWLCERHDIKVVDRATNGNLVI